MKNIRTLILVVLGIVIVLVTYFMAVTTQSKPTSMKLFLPKATDSSQVVSADSAALTLILYDKGVYAYRGNRITEGKRFLAIDSMLRKYILEVKRAVPEVKFTVVIKPEKTATYRNTVDALDEMTINDIKRYSLEDMSESDQQIIDRLRNRQII